MDFYQKTLVKYDEWYDYFQIHKKERDNLYARWFSESRLDTKFDFGDILEQTISFLPTYKYENSRKFDESELPSYADRVFFSYSKKLSSFNKINIIHYDSFNLESLKSSHKGVQMTIKMSPLNKGSMRTEEL